MTTEFVAHAVLELLTVTLFYVAGYLRGRASAMKDFGGRFKALSREAKELHARVEDFIDPVQLDEIDRQGES